MKSLSRTHDACIATSKGVFRRLVTPVGVLGSAVETRAVAEKGRVAVISSAALTAVIAVAVV